MAVMVVSVGCSSATDESKIKDTVNGAFSALNSKNYDKAFDYYAGASQMSQAEKDAAVEMLKTYWPEGMTITVKSIKDVKVTGSTATASVVLTVAGQDAEPTELQFVKEGDSWKIKNPTG